MSPSLEEPCPLLVPYTDPYSISAYDIEKRKYSVSPYDVKSKLAWGDAASMVSAMKGAITILVNGESVIFRDLSVAILRNVLPSKDRKLQKLFLLYLEVISKTVDAYGRVPPDRTLVCNHLRNSLEHGDELVRRDTLRFLCRLRDSRLAEPVVASVLANIHHPRDFVRRDAFAAVCCLCRLRRADGGKLVPDALDVAERDAAALRNAFFTLHCFAQRRAAAYVLDNAGRVASEWPGPLQMLAVDTARRYGRYESKHVDILMSLLSNPNTSNVVVYECAGTLSWISSEPTAVRAAANAYCKLLSPPSLQSDNEVRLIVQDLLHELCVSHTDTKVDLVKDRIASRPRFNPSPSTHVDVKKTLQQNVKKLVMYLKEELVKATLQDGEQLEETGAYGTVLVQAIHACAKEYPDVVAPVLMDLLQRTGA